MRAAANTVATNIAAGDTYHSSGLARVTHWINAVAMLVMIGLRWEI